MLSDHSSSEIRNSYRIDSDRLREAEERARRARARAERVNP